MISLRYFAPNTAYKIIPGYTLTTRMDDDIRRLLYLGYTIEIPYNQLPNYWPFEITDSNNNSLIITHIDEWFYYYDIVAQSEYLDQLVPEDDEEFDIISFKEERYHAIAIDPDDEYDTYMLS